MSHYYKLDGTPCYEVLGANGEARPPTLRDAKRGLRGVLRPYEIVPSVTTILRALGAPDGLVRWLVRTALECAATNPPRPDELADAYARRLAEDADRWRRDAARTGTAIHRACECILRREPVSGLAEDVTPWLPALEEWISENIREPILVEYPFACRDYGGKLDLYARLRDGRLVLVDFKTQGTSERYGHSTRTYPDWGEQLIAYADGVDRPWDALASVVISSTKPGLIEMHEWGEVSRLRKLWRAKLSYYKLANNWWPPRRQE